MIFKGHFVVQGVHKILCFFPENFVIFFNSASSAEALVFYLPGVCVHTLTPRENRVQNILKSSKKTQNLMNTL